MPGKFTQFKHSGRFAGVGVIEDKELPWDLQDHLVSSYCGNNDSGTMIYVDNEPAFREWLIAEGMPVEAPNDHYIVWWSW